MTDIASDQIPDVISQLVHLIAPTKKDRIGPDTKLVSELSYHSLAMVQLGLTIEDVFEFDSLPQERASSLETVHDIIELVRELLDEGEGALPTVDHLESIVVPLGGEWPPAA
ncbi:acyl carrier protein [Kitasatospora sp. NPDC056446]|uniref:acyl carrier protein n=1 Tax=Kitasatospora sp. NPDC056446 TaxID=3345819 RepID=UPI0036C473E8